MDSLRIIPRNLLSKVRVVHIVQVTRVVQYRYLYAGSQWSCEQCSTVTTDNQKRYRAYRTYLTVWKVCALTECQGSFERGPVGSGRNRTQTRINSSASRGYIGGCRPDQQRKPNALPWGRFSQSSCNQTRQKSIGTRQRNNWFKNRSMRDNLMIYRFKALPNENMMEVRLGKSSK